MAHMEPMDVDSISNDFDDKENSLQNSNVLPRTPSTEKGYEELDVSELNMKLRYSMTPANSPMSRSFTANCRDNKVCDIENNSINTIFNDNSNLSHSFNSTITDSFLKSSKLPLQVLPTEQFVDDNGNPIVRSLDVECNNVTITVNGTDNIDDNLSLPSTSSSLAHTPEATTPTKEIAKDGGSPIMRGLKSVLNMFRSSQSPIPSDDITTNNLSSFESHKKEESSNLTTNLGSSPTTTNKNKENNISKTNIPLKESLVFNEDLEKELLWKDETTILFKEEKIPIYKLFFPPNSTALESINSKPIEKENINTTIEYTNGSNETVNADKDINEVVKSTSSESDTLNSPESDSEFVDCETSYTKTDTRILDDIPTLSPVIKNISPEFSITDGNAFQPNEIGEDEHSLSVVADTNLTDQTKAIISNTQGVIKEADIDENFEHTLNDLPILKDPRDQINILSNSLKEDIPNDLADKCNTIVNENRNELVQCSDETFNLEKVSEVSEIDQEYKNDIVSKSYIVDNDATLSEEGKEDFKEFYPSQITKEMEDICSGDRVCDFDSIIALNELTFKTQTDDLKINNIELPLDTQDVNEEKNDLVVLQDTDKNNVIPLVKTEKSFNIDNKVNVKLDSEIIEDTILKQEHNNGNETVILSDQIIQLEAKEIKTISNNLPSDIPLPYDSDIDKDEENLRENHKSINISSNNSNFDLSHSTDSIKQTIDITSLPENISENLLNPEINNVVANIPELESSEDKSNIKKYITANESNVLEINNIEKCLPKVKDIKDMSFTIMNSVTSSNSSYSEGGVDLDVLTHHTQDNKNEFSENHVEGVARKSTNNENETSVIGMELDISKHDLEDSENPFETKNKLTESLEVQRSESVIDNQFLQNHVEILQTSKSTDNENETSVIEMELDVSRHGSENCENPFETKNKLTTSIEVKHSESVIEDGFLPNHVEIIQASKFTDNENETSVIEMELDISKHDLEDSENPFKTKNKLTASLEVQRSESVIEDGFSPNYIENVQAVDDKNYITNEIDARVKYNEFNIPITNRNIAGIEMDLDVPKHESENGVIPGPERDITGVVGKKSINGVDTFLNDKNEISIITDGKIKEEASLPSNFNNSLITEMELDVSNPGLEDVSKLSNYRNSIETQNQLKSALEAQGHESVIENISIDDCNVLRNGNDFKIDEVINIPTNNKSVTESDLDVLKHDLVSENINIKDGEIMNNSFKNVTRLTDKIMEVTSKSDVTINDELIVPLTKEISSEIDLGVPKHDEENIETTFKTKGIITPSPQISSKFTQGGYNIDFDKIDDPFTTKTNINKEDFINTETSKTITEYQMRPEPNRRKTLQDQNKLVTNEDANTSFGIFNSSFENRVQEIYVKDDEKLDFMENNTNSALFSSDKLQDDIEINTPGDCTVLGKTGNFVEEADINLSNQISSSSKMYESKNVFNLPEIGDMNFKPFTTSYINDKQKTSSAVCYNPLERTTIASGKDEAEKNNEQDLESNLSPNLSNVTCSSKNADEMTSLREVNTEDEDTVEGPFLEAEDFSDIVKVSDFETQKDMMNFEDLPTRTTDDNDNGEFFIDAEAFEFLLNQNKSNVVADSGKESLFLKFDPLFAKRISSDGVLSALKKIQKRQSTPKKINPLKITQEENLTPGPSSTTPIGVAAPVATDIVEEPVAAMSKPMMVVNPAVASFVSPRKSTTPPRVNRRSLTFTSPAMAVIDRLLSLSGNSSILDQDSSLPINREYNETDFALTQLRELLADKEIHVHNLRSESKELKERFAILESQVKSLETESEERLRKVKELNENLAEKNKINKSMAIVVEEYERTIASLIAEMEQERKQNAEERMKLISERDEQTAHLASMEVSFGDLHSKYEKSKQIILSMKANEDTYKKSLNEFEVNLLKMQTNYDLLKQHATSKLNHANQELEKYNRAHDAEVVKLNAMIKRKELQITSLEESLSQKTKANEELTAICDELINKVG